MCGCLRLSPGVFICTGPRAASRSVVLLCLAFLAAASALALLRLLPMSGRDKGIEILALRHCCSFCSARSAGLCSPAPTVRSLPACSTTSRQRDCGASCCWYAPDTILRWHRDLLNRRHAATRVPKRRGRPPTVRSVRVLVLCLGRGNSSWGYRRIHGEPAAFGIKTAASTVGEILREHGIPPAPERQSAIWADFFRGQAEALLACDLFEVRIDRGTPTSAPSSGTPPAGCGSWAPARTRPRTGSRSSGGFSSWTSRTPAAGPGS